MTFFGQVKQEEAWFELDTKKRAWLQGMRHTVRVTTPSMLRLQDLTWYYRISLSWSQGMSSPKHTTEGDRTMPVYCLHLIWGSVLCKICIPTVLFIPLFSYFLTLFLFFQAFLLFFFFFNKNHWTTWILRTTCLTYQRLTLPCCFRPPTKRAVVDTNSSLMLVQVCQIFV